MLNNIGLPGLILLASYIFVIYCKYVAFKKMGRNGWESLLLLIPVVNIAFIWGVAHGYWPNADGDGNLIRVRNKS